MEPAVSKQIPPSPLSHPCEPSLHGWNVGALLGSEVGASDGDADGELDGAAVGASDGSLLGASDGDADGVLDGALESLALGAALGAALVPLHNCSVQLLSHAQSECPHEELMQFSSSLQNPSS